MCESRQRPTPAAGPTGQIRWTKTITLCKVWNMPAAPSLQPTLWRTCRVLANRTRLQIFGLLTRTPALSVSAVAEHLQLSLPVASQYLRALEARGLLIPRRVGRRVQYRLNVASAMEPARELTVALRLAFQRDPAPVETLFRLATSFTHPRRIEIFRALAVQARTLGQLQAVTRISVPALFRHLRKLEARGFVEGRRGLYAAANRQDVFGRTLARLVAD